MSKSTRTRSFRRVVTLLLAVLTFAVVVLGIAPYEGAALDKLGLLQPAASMFAFTVRYLDGVSSVLAPDWAYMDLAQLRAAPEQIVDVARLAKAHHSAVALNLYERAISGGGALERLNWLEEYADFLAPADRGEAAKSRLAAAALAMNFGEDERAYGDFETSLALKDDGDIRWQEAQFLLHRVDGRAADVLQKMIEHHQNEATASHALGLIQWHDGKLEDAYENLRSAARDVRYRATLGDFLVGRAAANELDRLTADESAQNEAANSEHDEARFEHTALYERLKKFNCDVRQWSDWERHTDEELSSGCRNELIAYVVGRIAMLAVPMVLPELIVARAGVGAEIGAMEGRALSAEAVAAVRSGASAEEAYAFAATRSLRVVGRDGVPRSIRARKSYAWKTELGTEFHASLDAEQNWILKDIDLALEIRRIRITRYFRPREDREQATLAGAERFRDREILVVRESVPVVRVKLARIHFDSGATSDCNKGNDGSSHSDCDDRR
ncbi:MAG: hypothetical protein JO083_06825 [Candidatus Eremiobacteraeota bacterium]|nr:hypothetical protein [Candidatus Eremiobacteraeota bacterium]